MYSTRKQIDTNKYCRSCTSIGDYISSLWSNLTNKDNDKDKNIIIKQNNKQYNNDKDFKWVGLGVEMPR